MRLQLTALALLACFWPRHAGAQVAGADVRGMLYRDSDNTTVTTATAGASGTVLDRYSVRARYLADIISSASVDVVTTATKPFDETRHEGEGALAYDDGDRNVGGRYVYSVENDWRSHTFGVAGGLALFGKQLELAAAIDVGLNSIWRVDDVGFDQTLTSVAPALSATIVATRNDVVALGYQLSYLSGFLSSPYRYAFVRDAAGAALLGPAERHPERRIRHALAARYHRYLMHDSALRMHMRLYGDDWGIASLTASAEYIVGFGPIELEARLRGYAQSKASFYQPAYQRAMRFMTADRELGQLIDGFAGGGIVYRDEPFGPLHSFSVALRGDGFAFRYIDFPRLPSRTGLIAELGVAAEF
jgi:hypothetical protein